ncbi:MAG: hypothetical protein WCW13_03955 [archaeon]|jgi:1,4-dihydroxy-2-naphthoate octaprenyltransferase
MQNKKDYFQKIVAYLGIIRIYSLLDLILLLIAAGATNYTFAGAIILHLGFLAFLEHTHAHKYRIKIPLIISITLFVIGLIFYQKLEGIGFIVFSIIYSNKNKTPYSKLSPFARGAQHLFLIGGISGFFSILPWIAFVLLTIRNFAGDLRDATKDRKEKMQTLPIELGVKKDYPYLHLVLLFTTTFIWIILTKINLLYLIPIWLIQLLSYTITKR